MDENADGYTTTELDNMCLLNSLQTHYGNNAVGSSKMP